MISSKIHQFYANVYYSHAEEFSGVLLKINLGIKLKEEQNQVKVPEELDKIILTVYWLLYEEVVQKILHQQNSSYVNELKTT